jgi:hypothetical protein
VSLSREYREHFLDVVGDERTAGRVLPAGSAQRRFVLGGESSGRRLLVPYAFTLRPGAVSAGELRDRLRGVTLRHPALRCLVDYDETGLISQRWMPDTGVPWTELAVADAGEEAAAVRSLLTEGSSADDPEPVRAMVLRGPRHVRLLLVFDHTVMDEASLRLVTRDLFGQRRLPSEDERAACWQRYRSAAWRWLDAEVAASTADGIAYWIERLAPVAAARPAAATDAPVGGEPAVVDAEPLAVPSARVRSTLFPRLLAATHAALQSVDGTPSTVIYPWGARPDGVGAVVGCFMNTVFSGVADEPDIPARERWAEFATRCWDDLDHAGVPYDDVVLAVNRATRSGWSGTARCLLGLEDVAGRPPLGPPPWQVSEWLPSWLTPKCVVNTTARFDGRELGLRVVADAASFPPADGFMAAWRRSVSEYLSY